MPLVRAIPASRITVGVLLIVLAVAGYVALRGKPAVYRACEPCGLSRAEVDELIRAQEGVDPDTSMKVFLATFENPEDAKECLPCTQAIIDAAASKRTQ